MQRQARHVCRRRVGSRVQLAACSHELLEEQLHVLVALRELLLRLGGNPIRPVILVQEFLFLVLWHVIEIGRGEELGVFELELIRAVDDAAPLEIQGWIEVGVVLHQVRDHRVEVGRVHPAIQQAVLMPCCYARQRLLQEREECVQIPISAMAALPASLRVAAMPTPVKCSMPSTPQSEVSSALYEWEMMLKPLACAALEIALKISPL